MFPLQLNTLSEGELVAGTQRYFFASGLSAGKLTSWFLHHFRGSASLLVDGSAYLLLRESTMQDLIELHSSVSPSSGTRRLLLNRWSTGLTYDSVTYLIHKSWRTFRAFLIASRTFMSCQVMTSGLVFLSEDKTLESALSYSRTL